MLQLASPFKDPYITHVKNAVCFPLPKTNHPDAFSDLRLISIFPACSKLYEKIIYKQLYNFVNDNKIIPHCQEGFRKSHSTSTALGTVTDDIVISLDKKLSTLLVLLDFSKAFDKINHKLLCSKLKYFGLSLSSVSLIKSFLNNRSQCVRIDNINSSFKKITAGVSQGTILGPLLFIIYTSNIIQSTKF